MLLSDKFYSFHLLNLNEQSALDSSKIVIAGLIGTPYQGGKFDIEITIPERYPFEAPGVRFTTPVYHPNIDNRGRICMDLLKSQPTGTWKPTIHLSHLLISVQLLLSEPNPNDPLMPEIAEEFLKNREKFNATARSWTAEHATKSRHLEKGLEEPDSKRRKV
ncbi:ubiquitin-conjugating enzyme E2 T-like isoform X2 [Artemia franciscana]|uniref:ubiquitin-conjugating enzyme E2 T-like isoform X2 n=1 Tax=Artemia franciscana TaxID=6661 RepID=UPI0032DBBDC3